VIDHDVSTSVPISVDGYYVATQVETVS
jgi:hypothetical protein